MRQIVVFLGGLLVAASVQAQVGHTCVSGCDSEPAPSQSPAPSAPSAPSQQDMMNQAIVNGIQQGLVQGIQNFKRDQELQSQQERQRAQQQELERQQEQLRQDQIAEQQKAELQNSMMPLPAAAPPGLPTAFTHPLKKPVIKVNYANAARREHEALMCGLGPVFSRATSLGGSERQALQDFRRDLDTLRHQLSAAPSGDVNAQVVTEPSLNIQTGGANPQSLVARALAVRHEDTGLVTLSVEYHYTSAGKTEEGQTVIQADKYGRVLEDQADAGTEECLARID